MKQLFFDIDTQIDFLFPAGALYVPGAEKLIPTISRLNHHAMKNGILLISTMCAHSENDPEFRQWPPHCVVGTIGQQKPASTLTDHSLPVVAQYGAADLTALTEPRALASGLRDKPRLASQIILEKQQLDLFSNPKLPDLLRDLAAEEYVVYGVATEHCVRLAAMGLLVTGKPVTLLEDAIQHIDPRAAEDFVTGFRARGGSITRTPEAIAPARS